MIQDINQKETKSDQEGSSGQTSILRAPALTQVEPVQLDLEAQPEPEAQTELKALIKSKTIILYQKIKAINQRMILINTMKENGSKRRIEVILGK